MVKWMLLVVCNVMLVILVFLGVMSFKCREFVLSFLELVIVMSILFSLFLRNIELFVINLKFRMG